MHSTEEAHRRALLHLAEAVNTLAVALDRVKPEALKPGQTILGGDLQSDLASVRQSIAKSIDAIKGDDRHG